MLFLERVLDPIQGNPAFTQFKLMILNLRFLIYKLRVKLKDLISFAECLGAIRRQTSKEEFSSQIYLFEMNNGNFINFPPFPLL